MTAQKGIFVTALFDALNRTILDSILIMDMIDYETVFIFMLDDLLLYLGRGERSWKGRIKTGRIQINYSQSVLIIHTFIKKYLINFQDLKGRLEIRIMATLPVTFVSSVLP